MSVVAAACAAFVLAHGTLLGIHGVGGVLRVVDLQNGKTRWRLPPGVLGGHLLVHRDGALLTWFDADTGARVGDAVLQAYGSFVLVGASQDGRVAVLARTETRSTTFALVSRQGERDVSKPGHWRFEALAGSRLTLTRTAVPVLATVESVAGRYRFTLVRGAVRALDARTGSTHVVALAGDGYTLVPDAEDNLVWAVSLAAGRVLLVDGGKGAVTSSFRFPALRRAAYTVASLAPDGEHIAASDGNHVVVLTPATHSLQHVAVHVSIALGWSPDQRTLWVLGERSRISPLRLRLVH